MDATFLRDVSDPVSRLGAVPVRVTEGLRRAREAFFARAVFLARGGAAFFLVARAGGEDVFLGT